MPVIFEGAEFITLDSECSQAEAMATEGDIIVGLGGYRELRDRFPNAERIDLGGGYVIPAFNDCHCHILPMGLELNYADLSKCRTIEEIKQTLDDWANNNPDSEWISGVKYDQNLLAEKRHLSIHDLKNTGDGRPIFISHVSKHGAVVNQKALEISGINQNTPDPKDGEINRDETGYPTGVFLEGAIALVEQSIPRPSLNSMVKALEAAGKSLEQKGILAASDAWSGIYDLDLEIKANQKAINNGIPIRITLMPVSGGLPLDRLNEIRELFPDTQGRLKLGHLKFVIDGALGSRTAALFEPYDDTDDNGLLLYDSTEFYELIEKAHLSGWNLASHAIGDRAIDFVINAFAKVQAKHPRAEARHRIEHCSITSADQIKRIKETGLIIAAQPEFLFHFGKQYYQAVGDRTFTMKPFKSWLDAGIPVAFSSDNPIVSGDPILGIKTAVSRTGANGTQYSPEDRIDPLTALKLYTIGSAFATNDDQSGMLKSGMRADFAILSDHPEKIVESDVRVIGTSYSIKTDNQL